MSSASLTSGDFVLAVSYSQQAEATALEVNEPILRGMALTNRGEAYRELGQYHLANASAAQALALFQTSGFRRGEAIVLDNIGLVEFALGDYAQALQTIVAALEMAREIGLRSTEAYALLHLGLIYTETGQFDAAEQALSAANSIVHDLGDELTMFGVQAALANLVLARGRNGELERAHDYLNELLSLLLQEPPNEKTQFLPMWLYLTGIRVLQARNDPRSAQLIVRADLELRSRSNKITDNALRFGYLNIPEHSAITALARGFSSPEI